ncbi:cation transporting ATPase C-terminal domain-containing protein [Nocardia sp. NPDC049190]|uniref:cation transporting ATPase C-terminal domain-containing protein n=1 Tax=Nocardia sp. NPDC049190 TaxID=3155650 RepID=UPI0033CDE549
MITDQSIITKGAPEVVLSRCSDAPDTARAVLEAEFAALFDFATFAITLRIFHAGDTLVHTGWFVESLATQALVLFVIRTRRTPFFHSHPSVPLLTAALAAVAIGAALPVTPLAPSLGFTPLPGGFFLALLMMIAVYLALAEVDKHWFFRTPPTVVAQRERTTGHRIHRRAARFTTRPRAR